MTPELEKEVDDLFVKALCSECGGLKKQKSREVSAKIRSMSKEDQVFWATKNHQKVLSTQYCKCEETNTAFKPELPK